jgi:predicted solute-binding protein
MASRPAPELRGDGLAPAATYRVGRIPFWNSAPFFLSWPELGPRSEGVWAAAVHVPRLLGRAAEAGSVDAGLFAEADLARLETTFEPLVAPEAGLPCGLGISNRDHVESVLLFLRRNAGAGDAASAGLDPITEERTGRCLTAAEARRLEGARVALTAESSTSVRLLRLLFTEKLGVRAATFFRGGADEDLTRADAALVIGDQALRWRRTPPAGFALGMDLAAEWHAWTGLPFTFARWGVRRTVRAEAKTWLARFLAQSVEAAVPMLASADAFAASPLAAFPPELGGPEEMRAYLRLIRYRLGPDELLAAERFREWLRRTELLHEDF